ncbi:MAG: hypothetical protein ACPHCI_09955, partial [Solirubrobacterales bacterium]
VQAFADSPLRSQTTHNPHHKAVYEVKISAISSVAWVGQPASSSRIIGIRDAGTRAARENATPRPLCVEADFNRVGASTGCLVANNRGE